MDHSGASDTSLVSSDNLDLSESQDVPPTSEILTLLHSSVASERSLNPSSYDQSRENSTNQIANESHFAYQSEEIIKVQTASKSTVNKKSNEHACQQCGKIFGSKSHLKDHMISHSNEATYQCEICSKKLKYLSSLVQHRRRHTGNLPFKCSHCSKAYTKPSKLEDHLKKHCPTALRNCHVCEEGFGDMESLKQHLTTHMPPKKPRVVEKRFKCDYCNMMFKFPAHLREHTLIHTGEKPHECQFCGVCFTHKKTLKKHLLTHSDKVPPRRTQPAVNRSADSLMPSITTRPHSLSELNKTDRSSAATSQANSLLDLNKNECSSTELQDTETAELRLEEISTEVVLQDQYPTKPREEIACTAIQVGMVDKISDHMLSVPSRESSVHSQTPAAVSGDGLTLVNLQGDSVPFSGLQVQDLEHITTNLLGQINTEVSDRSQQGSTVEPTKKGRVHPKTNYCCEICGRKCKTKSHLHDHMISHSAVSRYQCGICDKTFKYKSSLVQHLRRHSGDVPFKCDECDAAFVKRSELRLHKNRHNPNSAKSCDRCGMTFKDRKSLRSHQRTVHKNEPRRSSVIKKKYVCSYCNKVVSCLSHLQTHVQTHTGEKPHKCEMCDRKFALKNTLKRHIRSHTGEKPFKCEKCSRHFADRCSLRRHKPICGECKVRRSTPKTVRETINKCKTCTKTFPRQGSLDKHSLTHIKGKRFVCHVCGLSFAFKTSLTKHSDVHPTHLYKCETCGLKFKSRGHFRFHCRHAHMATSRNQYKCLMCGKIFPRMIQLLGHEIFHGQGSSNQYQCDVCFQRYSTPRLLVAHRRKHLIENKLKCNTCQKDFKSIRALILHSPKHISNVSFVCSCKQSFQNHQSLVVHAQTHLPMNRSRKQLEISPVVKLVSSAKEPSNKHRYNRYKRGQRYFNRHRRNVHSVAKKSSCVCGICRKSFPTLLSVHYLTHLNSRSYSCHICRQSFNSWKILLVHLRIHADKSGPPVTCTVHDASTNPNSQIEHFTS